MTFGKDLFQELNDDVDLHNVFCTWVYPQTQGNWRHQDQVT